MHSNTQTHTHTHTNYFVMLPTSYTTAVPQISRMYMSQALRKASYLYGTSVGYKIELHAGHIKP